jgi:hypothetical protein
MTTLKEFQEKINKIQDKVDLKEDSHQKNKTLLQIIIDICNNTLKEPNLKEEVKNEANKVLKKVNNDISLMKGVIPEDNKMDSFNKTSNNYSIGGYAPAPIEKVLNSVHAGAFDPLSSPILRNLNKKHQKSPTGKLDKKSKPEVAQIQKKEPTEPQKKPQVKPKEEKIEKQEVKKTPEKKTIKKEPKIASIPKKTTKKVEKKSKKKTVSQKPTASISDKKEDISPLTSAFLEIEQIQLKIQLTFKNPIEMLGRQDFENKNLVIQIPEDFFSPIIKRDPNSKKAKEHCIIEQIELKKYFLKDRFNLKKTYFQGVFVDSKGTQLKDGDKFLLPVLVNEQLSSLTVIFHIGKQKLL